MRSMDFSGRIKKTLLKDSLREIKNTFSRFLAILAIVALSVAFFTGIRMTCPDMKQTADAYYDDYRLMDFRLLSTVGFTEEEIDAIRQWPQVRGVSPSYAVDAVLDAKDSNSVVRVHSLVGNDKRDGEDYLNRPLLVSGRLPEASGECVIEKSGFFGTPFTVGSTIRLVSGKEGAALDALKKDTFTVVGIIKSPLYVSKDRGTSNIGTGKIASYLFIGESDFNMSVYNTVYLTVKGAEELKTYSTEYDNQIEFIQTALEPLISERTQIRYDEIIADANKLLSTKEAAYEKAAAAAAATSQANPVLAAAKAEIEKAKAQIAAIPKVEWHLLGRNTNAGYVDYGGAADRMNAIAQVFPLIFILVGILICFTTMGRMVDEQRSYIGTVKALGYSKASIARKYLLYAILASLLGGAIGIAVGFTFFPSFIFKAFSALYTMPKFILIFDVPFAVASIAVGMGVTVLAALIVCFQELHASAASLMRPKAPKPGKIILLERIPFLWKRLKFTQKVTARNLLRYKSRFFMTVIGVAGCTALLLVGFGLQDAIGDIGVRQFTDINLYQMVVNIKDNLTDAELADINKTIESNPNFTASQLYMAKSISIGHADAQKDCGLLVPQDAQKLPDFISLHERISKKTVTLTDGGVVLTEKLARKIGVSVGDDIFIKTTEYDKQTVKVTGICENYLNHYMYMSPALYRKIFQKEPSYNSLYVNLKNITTADEEAISKTVLTQKGVAAVYISSDMRSRFKDTIKTINYVVLVLIVSAGLLSFIILYTLTNININERMREIATIKVLGFYDREVSAYVFKENLILTLIGSALGLVFGYYLSMFVIQTAEVDMIMFGREIHLLSFGLAYLMTLAFALFVNFVMLRKIRNINMVEALKTVE